MSMSAISQSVGGGKATNNPDDVRRVQTMLNAVPAVSGGPQPPLDVTGAIDDETVAAITAFQQARYPSADGVVSPTGRTIQDLAVYANAATDPDPRADVPEVFCDVRVTAGPCGRDMMDRLREVEASLREQSPQDSDFKALYGIQTVDGHQGRGVPIPVGKAVDLNANTNPYVVTRSSVNGRTMFGGEQGGTPLGDAMRAQIASVYDRAVAWGKPGSVADMNVRRPGETTESVYLRFRLVSTRLGAYLSFAIRPDGPTRLTRPVIPDVATADDAHLRSAIPAMGVGAERWPDDDARTHIKDFLAQFPMPAPPGGRGGDVVAAWHAQMLRDYEIMRLPLVLGPPSPAPKMTRNPVYGFMDLPLAVVDAMVRAGLAWGACDLGPAASGDMMHFQTP
jgi:putative peptidoglycan binding protein